MDKGCLWPAGRSVDEYRLTGGEKERDWRLRLAAEKHGDGGWTT
jgi:hypothetical protein